MRVLQPCAAGRPKSLHHPTDLISRAGLRRDRQCLSFHTPASAAQADPPSVRRHRVQEVPRSHQRACHHPCLRGHATMFRCARRRSARRSRKRVVGRWRQTWGLVPILRAGLGMVEGAWTLLPQAEVWHLGLYRDERTLRPVEYYNKLPVSPTVELCLLLDPMLATGGSAIAAVDVLKRWGVSRIKFVGSDRCSRGHRGLPRRTSRCRRPPGRHRRTPNHQRRCLPARLHLARPRRCRRPPVRHCLRPPARADLAHQPNRCARSDAPVRRHGSCCAPAGRFPPSGIPRASPSSCSRSNSAGS